MAPDQLATKADIARLGEHINQLRLELRKQNPEPQGGDRMLSRQQLADYFGLSLSTIDKYTREKILPSFRLGANVMYSENEIRKSLEGIRERKPIVTRKMKTGRAIPETKII